MEPKSNSRAETRQGCAKAVVPTDANSWRVRCPIQRDPIYNGATPPKKPRGHAMSTREIRQPILILPAVLALCSLGVIKAASANFSNVCSVMREQNRRMWTRRNERTNP